MNKKEYKTPCVSVYTISAENSLLAHSMNVEPSKRVNPEDADAKLQNFWNDDDCDWE